MNEINRFHPLISIITARRAGMPDVILSNQLFSIFNYLINKGNDIGSDHRIIVFKIQIQPYLILTPSVNNLKSLDINKYNTELSRVAPRCIDGLPSSQEGGVTMYQNKMAGFGGKLSSIRIFHGQTLDYKKCIGTCYPVKCGVSTTGLCL